MAEPTGEKLLYPAVRLILASRRAEESRRKDRGVRPFLFLPQALLTESTGLKLDQSLQRLADSNLPLLRSSGYVYVVAAVK